MAEPHASLAYVKLYFDWDWAGAEEEFLRAVAHDPNWAAAHEWYSIYLLVVGRSAEALHEITTARQRDPMSVPINTDLGFHYYYTGQYEEALKQLKFVLAMNDGFAPAHLWLGRAYQELGQYGAALAAFRRVEELVPDWPVTIAARGCVEGIARHRAEAEATLLELERLATRKFVTPMALHWFKRALVAPKPRLRCSTRRLPRDPTGSFGCASTRAGTCCARMRDLPDWCAACASQADASAPEG